MNDTLVSVIIPTYKRNWDVLYRAIESVLNQTYKNTEIIVIDDSPDDFQDRKLIENNMSQLCQHKQNVIFIQNEKNIGGSLSRNKGIEISKGTYITFLDDDDEYLPKKIENQIKFMQENNCDLSFEDMTMYNDEDKVVDVREHKDIKSFENAYLLSYHLTKHMTGTPTFMFKADALKKIGGFDDAKMGQEFLLMLKSIENALTIRYFPVSDVKIYKHTEGGISQGKNKIDGELKLYNFKKKYFSRLSKKEKMFIRYRHFAVMVVAYLRNKMFLHAVGATFCAFFASPLDFFCQTYAFFIRIFTKRGYNNESL